MTVTDNHSPLVIIYGENGEGKSLLTKLIEHSARKDKIITRSASMGNRTSSEHGKLLIFGDESKQSTGSTSIVSTRKCIEATHMENTASIAVLDEPDIGLSSYYTKAFGEYIAQSVLSFEDNKGIVLITHSKILSESVFEHYNGNISSIGINTPLSLSNWLNRDDCASVEELLNLPITSRKKQDRIENALAQYRKNKR